jgi:hypothetical protein
MKGNDEEEAFKPINIQRFTRKTNERKRRRRSIQTNKYTTLHEKNK